MSARRILVRTSTALCLLVPVLAGAAPARADGAAAIVITASATAAEFPESGDEPEIVGQVTDPAGNPLANVPVELTSTSASQPTPSTDDTSQTAADGSFVLAPIPPSGNPATFETRTFTVSHLDTDGSFAAAASAPVVIGVPASFTGLESSAERIAPGNNYWTIEGEVSGPVGSPVLGQVRVTGGWKTVTQVTSTPLTVGKTTVNRFAVSFPGLTSGSQTVRVVRPTDAYQDETDSPSSKITYGWTPLVGSRKSFGFTPPLTNGVPLHYDHCTYLTWAFNPAGAPAGALNVLREVFREAGHYSGYHFRYVGATKEKPSLADASKRLASNKGPEILVKWVKAQGETDFTKGYHGEAGLGGSAVGGSSAFPRRGGGTLLLIQHPNGVDLPMDFAPDGWGAIGLHELGNVLGLNQVKDKTQIMYPGAEVASQYGAGDAAGLARLGHAKGCGGG